MDCTYRTSSKLHRTFILNDLGLKCEYTRTACDGYFNLTTSWIKLCLSIVAYYCKSVNSKNDQETAEILLRLDSRARITTSEISRIHLQIIRTISCHFHLQIMRTIWCHFKQTLQGLQIQLAFNILRFQTHCALDVGTMVLRSYTDEIVSIQLTDKKTTFFAEITKGGSPQDAFTSVLSTGLLALIGLDRPSSSNRWDKIQACDRTFSVGWETKTR